MFSKVKIRLIINLCAVFFTAKLNSQVSNIATDCQKWVFVASDSINTYHLHRQILGRVMQPGDSLQLILCNENSIAWTIHKSDSIFMNTMVDSNRMTFKHYDTINNMEIVKSSDETLILGNSWYKLVFTRDE